MAKRTDLPTHSDVEETVQEHDEKMDEKVDELEVYTEDTETVRDTHEALELETTVEGSEAVETDIDAAEDVTVEIFDSEDDVLEGLQDDTQEYADELHERHDTGESDLEKISDASGRVDTQETINELANAKTSTLEEMDFLQDNNEKAEEAKEESEQAQQELENRINAGRRS